MFDNHDFSRLDLPVGSMLRMTDVKYRSLTDDEMKNHKRHLLRDFVAAFKRDEPVTHDTTTPSDEQILLPVKSHHCRTTHSACDCMLANYRQVRDQLTAAKRVVEAARECSSVVEHMPGDSPLSRDRRLIEALAEYDKAGETSSKSSK